MEVHLKDHIMLWRYISHWYATVCRFKTRITYKVSTAALVKPGDAIISRNIAELSYKG